MSQALPDVRDGLRLVHRRVLLAMHDAGLMPGDPHKKSVVIVRDVFKRRPRVRDSAYDALVAMVQGFTFRYPLIEGHGNFGSIEGDGAASCPYTEVRLSPIGNELLADTDRGDGLAEPAVLGSAFPNVVVNGSSSVEPNTPTNIPPHNLREVVNAISFLIDHPDATATDLRAFIPGPDFPTGGFIDGHDGIAEYQETGRGRITVRAHVAVESDEVSNRPRIAITDIPYGVMVAPLIAGIADLVRDRVLEGISDLRNESDRDGMRIAMVLKRDTPPQRILEQLYERTAMQTTIDVNMTALVPHPETGLAAPRVLTLKELLEHFIAHRHAVIARRIPGGGTNAERARLIKDDLRRIADAYGDRRRTVISSPTARL